MELQQSMIKLNQSFSSKEDAIKAAGQLLFEGGYVNADYIDGMLEREEIVTTYMGNFVAIPHGTDKAKEAVLKTGIAILQVPMGIDFAPNEAEEKMAMMIFGIAGLENEHLEILSKIAVFCSEVDNVVRLVNASSADEIIQMLGEVEV